MSRSPAFQFPTTFACGTGTRAVFGNGSAGTVGERVAGLGARRVFFILDSGVHAAGLAERVERSLREAGVAYELFSGVSGEPTAAAVQAAVDAARAYDPEALIAMGGGSALDTGKAVAAIAANGGTVLEHMYRERQLTRAGVPVIALPTTSGTGAEVTSGSGIVDPARRHKGGVGGPLLAPHLAVCDPELTLGLPPSITADTGLDALSHCLECYTNTSFSPLAKLLALEGIRIVGRHLRPAVANGASLMARWQMMWAAHLGGLCIALGGLGYAHTLVMPVGAFGVPHGRAIAILLPPVMEFSLPGAVEAYADVAEALGERVAGLSPVAAAERAVAAVRRLVADCLGTPRLGDFGVGEEHLEGLVRGLGDGFGRAMNPRQATDDDARAILRAAL